MKFLQLSFLILFCQTSIIAQNKKNATVYPILENGDLIFLNNSGKIVRGPYQVIDEEKVYPWNNVDYWDFVFISNSCNFCIERCEIADYIVFVKKNKQGLINKNGDVILKPIFDEIEVGRNSAYVIFTLDGKKGFADFSGNLFVKQEFDQIYALNDSIFKVVKNDKVGLMSNKGVLLLPCKYDDIRILCYQPDLFKVSEDKFESIYDLSEQRIIIQPVLKKFELLPCPYNSKTEERLIVGTDSSGLSVYSVSGVKILDYKSGDFELISQHQLLVQVNKKTGIYNFEKNRFDVLPVYDKVTIINNCAHCIETGVQIYLLEMDGKYGIQIDSSLLFSTEYSQIDPFCVGEKLYFEVRKNYQHYYGIFDSNEYVWFHMGSGVYRRYSYPDKTFIIQNYSAVLNEFRDTIFSVDEIYVPDWNSEKLPYIVGTTEQGKFLYDLYGNQLTEPLFISSTGLTSVKTWQISENAIAYQAQSKKYGVIITNKNNPIILEPVFDEIDIGLPKGYFQIQQDGRWGVLTETGEIRIQPEYDNLKSHHTKYSSGGGHSVSVEKFYSEIVICQKDEKYGVIGLNGEIKIPCVYDEIIPTENLFFHVSQFNKKFLIHFNGEKFRPTDLDTVYECADFISADSVFIIELGGKFGFADWYGNVLFTPKYENVKTTKYPGLWEVKLDGKTGLINRNGSVISECIYDKISYFNHKGYATVMMDSLIGIIDRYGSIKVPPQREKIDAYTNNMRIVACYNRPLCYINSYGDTIYKSKERELYFGSRDYFDWNFCYLSGLETLIINNARFLSNNMLVFPSCFYELHNLQRLELTDLWFDTLYSEIGNMKSLRTLKIKSYFLTELPSTISSLDSLKTLSINCTQIRTLPKEISEIKSLDSLTIYIYSEIPEGIENIQTLDFLSVNYYNENFFAETKVDIPYPINHLPKGYDLYLPKLPQLKSLHITCDSLHENILYASQLKEISISCDYESEIKTLKQWNRIFDLILELPVLEKITLYPDLTFRVEEIIGITLEALDIHLDKLNKMTTLNEIIMPCGTTDEDIRELKTALPNINFVLPECEY